jgi:hypothetical protein
VFSLYMLPMRNFTRPTFVLPHEELACAIFLFRNVPVADAARYTETVATVRQLDMEMRESGGKAYPPYAPFYSAADWETHYGPLWRRLVASKRAFDPGNILTRGCERPARSPGEEARRSDWSLPLLAAELSGGLPANSSDVIPVVTDINAHWPARRAPRAYQIIGRLGCTGLGPKARAESRCGREVRDSLR